MPDDIQITNCHVHTFNRDFIPPHFPNKFLVFLDKIPGATRFLAWITKPFRGRSIGAMLHRKLRMKEVGEKENQELILEDVAKEYPDDARFVILPMEMGFSGYGTPKKLLHDQHQEILEISEKEKWAGRVIPFCTCHPEKCCFRRRSGQSFGIGQIQGAENISQARL